MLRMSEIRRRTSLSVSHLYALIAEGLFPPLVPFGARATGTLEDLVDAWLCARIDARDAMSSLHDPVVLPRWSAESVRVPALRAVRMLTLSEVEARVGMKKTSLYRAIASGAFPAPAPLTSNARRWPAHEIDAWVQTRIERSLRKAKQRVPAAFCASTVAPLAFARVRLPSRSRTQLISVPVRSPRALVHSNVAGSLLTDSDWALRVWRRCPCCVVSRSAFVSRGWVRPACQACQDAIFLARDPLTGRSVPVRRGATVVCRDAEFAALPFLFTRPGGPRAWETRFALRVGPRVVPSDPYVDLAPMRPQLLEHQIRVHYARTSWQGVAHRLGRPELVITADAAMATRIPRFVPLLRGSWRIALGRVGLFRPTLGVMFSKLSERLFSDSWDDGAPFGPWIPNSLGLCARIGALIGALRSPSTFGFSQSGGDPSRGGRCQCP